MERQLALIEPEAGDEAWRLDEHTREVGRLGIEQAREALRAAKEQAERHQPAA